MRLTTSILSLLLASTLGTAFADPVVEPGGKPGVARAWKTTGSGIRLTIDADYDAEEVAQAIQAGVDGAKAKVVGGKVLVTGVTEATLLGALEKVDVGTASDDVDEMLSALQNPGGEDDGSGSSIRAGKKMAVDAMKGPPGPLVYGKVVDVQRGRYPLVLVHVNITKTPKSGQGPKRGSKVRILPYVKAKNGVVDQSHPQSQLNVGAWYAQKGDVVRVRLEPKMRNGVWVAKAFERVD